MARPLPPRMPRTVRRVGDEQPGRAERPRRRRADELSRRRRTRGVVPDTGRQHHLGGPPPAAPVHGPDGEVDWTDAAPVRVRQLHDRELTALAGRLSSAMTAAAGEARYEEAARLRDRLEVVSEELERRGLPRDGAAGA